MDPIRMRVNLHDLEISRLLQALLSHVCWLYSQKVCYNLCCVAKIVSTLDTRCYKTVLAYTDMVPENVLFRCLQILLGFMLELLPGILYWL